MPGSQPRKFVVFGLSLSSSRGNGHAFTFFDKDVPWYAEHRDCAGMAWAELVIYRLGRSRGTGAARSAAVVKVAAST